ncbi:MAG: zinc metallopeptidase [Planctomycetaceae bacterium]|nr:zinc metallopeptidase [Planctomycetaceae bacterium]
MIFDPMYLVFVAPALLFAFIAQAMVSSRYASASKVPASMTGAQAARRILDSAGLHNVGIERTEGHLSDHYDPSAKVLRLSPEVYANATTASVGIAAHEAGHAIQDAVHYKPMVLRSLAVPLASFGSNAAFILFFIGLFVQALHFLAWIGIMFFSFVVVFQVVTLPVEFNASARAKQQLSALGIVSDEQAHQVKKVLGAAAMTYVAATLMALLQLLYLLSRLATQSRD